MLRILKVARALIREKVKDLTRSPRWPAVRDGFLKTNPTCAACGGTLRLQVHHVKPFHAHPELELDPRNLITLCMGSETCHLDIGHGDNWKAWNPGVRQDAIAYADKARRAFIKTQARLRALRVLGLHGIPSPGSAPVDTETTRDRIPDERLSQPMPPSEEP